MKYRNKANPETIIEAHLWDPNQPAAQRPDWLNRLLSSGEVVQEYTDALSLPFPAIGSVLPGNYIAKVGGDVYAVLRSAIDKNFEPVQE